MIFRVASALTLTGLALVGGVVSGARAGASGKAFTSARYHYSISVPSKWKIVAAVTDPAPGQFPAADGGETDKFLGPGHAPRIDVRPEMIGIAAEKLRTRATAQSWTRKTIAELHAGFGCGTPTQSTRVLAGEPTNELIYDGCAGSYTIVLATVHHGRGYDVYWLSPWMKDGSGYAADRAAFDRILRTFRFTD